MQRGQGQLPPATREPAGQPWSLLLSWTEARNQNVAAQPKSAGWPGRSPAQEQVSHLLGAEGKQKASYKKNWRALISRKWTVNFLIPRIRMCKIKPEALECFLKAARAEWARGRRWHLKRWRRSITGVRARDQRGVPGSTGTDDNSNRSKTKSAVGKKIRSCGDSKLVWEIYYRVSKDESIHSTDYKCTAIINDSAQSVLLSRLLN